MIHPYVKNQSKLIESMCSIKEFNGRFYHNVETTGFYMKEIDMFLTHECFQTKLLQEQFPDYIIDIKTPDMGKQIPTYELNDDIDLTDVQYDVMSKAINSRRNKIFLNLPTAMGKTVIAIQLMISVLSKKVFIMCFRNTILKQWIRMMKEHTNTDMSKVCLIDSGAQLDAILDNNFVQQDCHIFLATPTLLHRFGEKHGWNKINDIFTNLGIGVKIYDEAHRHLGNIIKIDAVTNVYKTIYLSADFKQADEHKNRLYKRVFKNADVFKLDRDVVDDLKYTNAIVIHYSTNPTEEDRKKIFGNNHGFSKFEFMRYEISQKILLNAAKHYISIIQESNKFNSRILVLVSLVEHVELLYEEFKSIYSDSYIIGRFHSKVPEDEKKVVLSSAQIIISTYQSFSTGLDLQGDKIGHILSLDQVNEVEDNQSAGRGRRDDRFDTYYYIFVDDSFPYCIRKLRKRLQYLYNQKIKQIFSLRY